MKFKLALQIGSRVLGVIADRLEASGDDDRAAAVRMAQSIIDAILSDGAEE